MVETAEIARAVGALVLLWGALSLALFAVLVAYIRFRFQESRL